jgi:hypothetical protein
MACDVSSQLMLVSKAIRLFITLKQQQVAADS